MNLIHPLILVSTITLVQIHAHEPIDTRAPLTREAKRSDFQGERVEHFNHPFVNSAVPRGRRIVTTTKPPFRMSIPTVTGVPQIADLHSPTDALAHGPLATNTAELPPPASELSAYDDPASPRWSSPGSEDVAGPAAARPFTLREFAQAFRPAPGHYQVVLLHPHTGRPVEVRFQLPEARLQEMDVDSDEIEFEYDDFEVEIEFRHDGRVEVEYDN